MASITQQPGALGGDASLAALLDPFALEARLVEARARRAVALALKASPAPAAPARTAPAGKATSAPLKRQIPALAGLAAGVLLTLLAHGAKPHSDVPCTGSLRTVSVTNPAVTTSIPAGHSYARRPASVPSRGRRRQAGVVSLARVPGPQTIQRQSQLSGSAARLWRPCRRALCPLTTRLHPPGQPRRTRPSPQVRSRRQTPNPRRRHRPDETPWIGGPLPIVAQSRRHPASPPPTRRTWPASRRQEQRWPRPERQPRRQRRWKGECRPRWRPWRRQRPRRWKRPCGAMAIPGRAAGGTEPPGAAIPSPPRRPPAPGRAACA